MYYIVFHCIKKTGDELIHCPDGIAAASVVFAALKKCDILDENIQILGDVHRSSNEYEPIPPFDIYPFVKDDGVCIIDFSYPASWMRYWIDEGVDLTIIDHHADKFNELSQFSQAILDQTECGATLAWKEFFPNTPIPHILKDVKRRDIGFDGYYEGLIPQSEAFNEGLASWRNAFGSTWDLVAAYSSLIIRCAVKPAFEDGVYAALLPLGVKKMEYRDKIVDEACSRYSFKGISDGEKSYLVPYVFLNEAEARYVSVIGNALAKRYAKTSFAWCETNNGHNLRSTKDSQVDIVQLAKYHGGGGHPRAAGFSKLTINQQKKE
ncbi:MAG: hypothetical protein F6K63_29865 [Moorea sp. SIO1G6]|uniref:DHH family phosphoesterase n=1 Tax=Moorena sp. SIO1G6 TaxID=2607840 RepID=UPI0013C11F7E|nr:DHH family phosphoesterase [Moorena sp. SIO1G6]NET68377.1 hypothetical protein [Moorena sp. SIO1G6]